MKTGRGSGVRVAVEVTVDVNVCVGVAVNAGVGVCVGCKVGGAVPVGDAVTVGSSGLIISVTALPCTGEQAVIKKNNPRIRGIEQDLNRRGSEKIIVVSNFPIHQSKSIIPILYHDCIRSRCPCEMT